MEECDLPNVQVVITLTKLYSKRFNNSVSQSLQLTVDYITTVLFCKPQTHTPQVKRQFMRAEENY